MVFVTVDPERDTAQRLRQYLGAFDPGFVGGTGAPDAMAAVRRRSGVTAEKVPLPNGNYAVNHSTPVYLIDREGRLRAMMPYGRGPKDFAHDFRQLLASR